MGKINWRNVVIVIGVVFLLAGRRTIGKALAELRLGDLWREQTGLLWAMPPFGRYVLLLSFLALLYITAYFLILNCWRRR